MDRKLVIVMLLAQFCCFSAGIGAAELPSNEYNEKAEKYYDALNSDVDLDEQIQLELAKIPEETRANIVDMMDKIVNADAEPGKLIAPMPERNLANGILVFLDHQLMGEPNHLYSSQYLDFDDSRGRFYGTFKERVYDICAALEDRTLRFVKPVDALLASEDPTPSPIKQETLDWITRCKICRQMRLSHIEEPTYNLISA